MRQSQRCADAVQTLVDRGEIAYGITTGFGAFKDKIISPDEAALLQRNIVLSHAVGVGDPFDTPTVRAIMLIRANTLARGFSGHSRRDARPDPRVSQSRSPSGDS